MGQLIYKKGTKSFIYYLILLILISSLLPGKSNAGSNETKVGPFNMADNLQDSSLLFQLNQVSSFIPDLSITSKTSPLEAPITIAWVSQFGTSASEYVYSVAADNSGNIYLSGHTYGTFPGQTNYGNIDAFVTKYGAKGDLFWTRQFGSPGMEMSRSLAVDDSGNIYVAGYTSGVLTGQKKFGEIDAFLMKYDFKGNILWSHQFGTSTTTIIYSLAVDNSKNIYVAGYTNGTLPGQTNYGKSDAFLKKYEPSVSVSWTHQFGTIENDVIHSLALDGSGNIYVAGYTSGSLPGQVSSGRMDAFLSKYDAWGSVAWTRQFGSYNDDRAYSVAVDISGNVYIAGYTFGSLTGQSNLGSQDAFLRKYDASGNELWTRQFGSSDADLVYSLAVDGIGNIYVAGSTHGTLPDQTNYGYEDIFLRIYGAGGNEIFTRQFGSPRYDSARSVSLDSSGNVYIAGDAEAALPGQSSFGQRDGFLIKFTRDPVDNMSPPVPSPVSPEDGYITDSTPAFTWSSVMDYQSEPVLYDLQVSSSSSMDSPLINKAGLSATIYNLSKYESLFPGTYYWRVRARDSATPPNYSSWSSPPWNFTSYPYSRTSPPPIAWGFQFGIPLTEASSLSVDPSGNIYIVGNTGGAFPGQTHLGSWDAFLNKYDASGSVAWTRQFGTPRSDWAKAIALDSSGNIYIAGYTHGAFPGQANYGSTDAFLEKYNALGSVAWIHQFGSSGADEAYALAVDDAGNIYVAGSITISSPNYQYGPAHFYPLNKEAFIKKFDSRGSLTWSHQFGLSYDDGAYSIAIDREGNIYLAGYVRGALPGQTHHGGRDAFLRKYHSSGSIAWTHQFGSRHDDTAHSAVVDDFGNIYVAGSTQGTLPGQKSYGYRDAFLVKFHSTGSIAWNRQFGTSDYEAAYSVAPDRQGNIYVAGSTSGALPEQRNYGSNDAFLRKYNAMGFEVWTRQFGSFNSDYALSVSVDKAGNIYVTGKTWGYLHRLTGYKVDDAFLVKFSQEQEGIRDPFPPAVPSPTLPINGTTIYTFIPTFNWSAVTSPHVSILYELQISTSSAMESLIIYKANLATNVYTLSTAEALASGQLYWWRVRARDSFWPPNYSNWSSPAWSFRTYWQLWTLNFYPGFPSPEGIKTDIAIAEANNDSTTASTDIADIPDPPPPPASTYIDIEFLSDNTPLSTDSRPLTGAPASASWEFRITPSSDVISETRVSLSWNLSHVPGDYLLSIQDMTTGTTLSLWDSPSYTYHATIGTWRNFKLFSKLNRPPSVRVLYPGGGEILRGTVTVAAMASDIDSQYPFSDSVKSITFFYSPDGGKKWLSMGKGSLISGTQASGLWAASWNTSTLFIADGSNYMLKAVATDKQGLSASDISKSTFTISNTLWSISISGETLLFNGKEDRIARNSVMATVKIGSSNGVDLNDEEEPPPPPTYYFDLYFILRGAGRFSIDSRPPAAAITWSPLVAKLSSDYDVDLYNRLITISWSLSPVPPDYWLFFIDDGNFGLAPATATINMRSINSYTYSGGSVANKFFTIRAVKNSPPIVNVLYPNEDTLVDNNIKAFVFDPDGSSPYNDFVTSVSFFYSSSPWTTWSPIGAGTLISGTPASGVWAAYWNILQVPEGKDYKVRVIVRDSLGAISMDESDEAFSLLHPITTLNIFQEGWVMWSYPLLPYPNTHPEQLGKDISPLHVFHYNAKSGIYELTTVATPGWSYWTKVKEGKTITMTGFPIVRPFFEIPLESSWNQIGNPYHASLAWSRVLLRKDGIIKSLLDASVAGWVNQWLYNYKTSEGVYEIKGASEGILLPMAGYWFKANQPGLTLIIPSS